MQGGMSLFRRALLMLALLTPVSCAQWSTSRISLEDPALLAGRWAVAFTKGDLNALMGVYDRDAILWGTSASSMRKGAPAIRDYYGLLFAGVPGTRIALRDTSARLYGDTAVTAGTYVLHGTGSDGRQTSTLVRFVMVCVKRDGAWVVAEHYLSPLAGS
jgi:uncharacterized protein (TIGR02246 family)